ncbi:MAG TPA: hypothetical protein PLC65_09615, partial [Bacteroidia bacterium]|nr:hypothetical protein [Bacteroidia bacterium]
MNILLKYSQIIAFSAVLAACGGQKDGSNGHRSEGSGGFLRISEVTLPKTIFPQATTNYIEGLVAG